MMNRRDTQIYLMLYEGKDYIQIGEAFGITRERVRQIAKMNHWDNMRFPRPDGYMSIKEYVQLTGIPEGTVRGRIKRGMPHIRWGDRVYIQARIRPVCITCEVEIQEGRVYCPECLILSTKQARWRAINRRFCATRGKKIPPNQEKRPRPKRKYAEVGQNGSRHS